MKNRKWLIFTSLLGALTLVAAACADDDDGDGAEPGGAAQTCNADEFGCVEYGAGEPIKLGSLLSISGATASLGNDSVTGIQLAIDNLDGSLDGQDGTLLGRSVNLVQEDDLCSADGGQTGGTKLAADPTIVGVIGTTCSSSALGVADTILSEEGIILFSPSNTNPNLTDDTAHQPFYLRTAHNDKIQGAVVANFTVEELQAETAATIHDESPYADALAAVFRANFEEAGGTITANEAIQSTDTDFKPLLTSIGQGKPDVLYFPNFNPACGLIAKQAAGIAGLSDTTLIGSDGCADSTYDDVGGDAVNGTFVSAPDLTGFQQLPFYQDTFLPAYQDLAGTKPTAAFHAHAFDATNILFQAIEAVAIEEGDRLFIPRTALKDEVFTTTGYEGVTGTLTCTELGDCATEVTIGVYEVPNDPFVGEDPKGAPVFSQTLTLEEAG